MRLFPIMRLVSQALPIGAFAWSGGLEGAIEAGVVSDVTTAETWIADALVLGLARWDLPLLRRIIDAVEARDAVGIEHWNARFIASRETAELLHESEKTGAALMRLLRDLDTPAFPFEIPRRIAYPTAIALASFAWRLNADEAAHVMAYGFVENQLAVLCKALPLGQVGAQRLLSLLSAEDGAMDAALRHSAVLRDAELVSSLPGLAVLSSRHEVQYSRLFRS